MKKLLYFLLFAVIIGKTTILPAQVSISGAPSTPDPSAMLDVQSTSKGFLMPRLTTAQRNLIASPAAGLQIFNLDDQCLDTYDGANWMKNCGLKQVGIGDSTGTNAWVRKTDFGGTGRWGAVGFSIGAKGYIGTGYDGSYKKDFWEYDPAGNTWTQKTDFGGTARYYAVGFGIGTKGYIGTGYDGTNKSDFWEYDPTTNTWTVKANFGGTARARAVGFSIGAKGYVGTGLDGAPYRKDFWEYNPATNSWTPKADFGGTARGSAVGFSIGTKGYIGTGDTGEPGLRNDFWEYDPTANSWVFKANFGGTERYGAVGFGIGTKGYIGTGIDGGHRKDFWEYDQAANTWAQKPDLGGEARSEAVGFTIGSKGYIGTGNPGGSILKDFWQYTPTVSAPIYAMPLPAGGSASISDGIWTLNSGKTYNADAGNVGIGTSSPSAKLEVNGQVKISGGTPGAGKVLVSDATGLASWGAPVFMAPMFGGIGGGIPTIAGTWQFLGGGTASVSLNGSQRVAIMVTAALGRTAVGNTQFNLDVGYQNQAGGPVTNASGGGYLIYNPNFAANDRQSFAIIGTFKPVAGTYTIGPVISCPTAGYLTNNDFVNGYYMIISE